MLVIIDKDGTLIEPVSGEKFVKAPTDQRLLPGVADRIAELKALGATIVIASNQGGVAAGHKSLEDAIEEMQYCLKLIPEIEYAFFCPDFEGRTCYYVHRSMVDSTPEMAAWEAHSSVPGEKLVGSFRKRIDGEPGDGMLRAAMAVYPMLRDVVMIGDRPEDRAAASQARVTFVDAEAWRTGSVQIIPGGAIA